MGACCRKLFLCLTYPSFSNVVSAEVGVAWEYATVNYFYRHISLLFVYAVSAEVGIVWEDAAANCFYVSHIPPF